MLVVLSFCGTEAYLAPEMILRLPYGASVDFWQYGCFVYELYAGRSPFWLPRKPRKFIRENILNGVFAYPSVVPEPAKGITGALLQVMGLFSAAYPLFHCNKYKTDQWDETGYVEWGSVGPLRLELSIATRCAL